MQVCSKRQGTMEVGIVLDKGHGDNLNIPQWLEGEPERSFWTGVKTKGKERVPVRTYRCTQCGYLESYARRA